MGQVSISTAKEAVSLANQQMIRCSAPLWSEQTITHQMPLFHSQGKAWKGTLKRSSSDYLFCQSRFCSARRIPNSELKSIRRNFSNRQSLKKCPSTSGSSGSTRGWSRLLRIRSTNRCSRGQRSLTTRRRLNKQSKGHNNKIHLDLWAVWRASSLAKKLHSNSSSSKITKTGHNLLLEIRINI